MVARWPAVWLPAPSIKGDRLELRNEFSHVRVELDTAGNGPRLMIQGIKTGAAIYLDPLEPESLTWMRHADLAPLLNPALGRWRDPEDVHFEQPLRELRTHD